MDSEEAKILDQISKKLDKIAALLKISLKKELSALRKEIEKDKVSMIILEIADGSISYSELKTKVAEQVGVSEITVHRRISELAENGLIFGRRDGREVFYTNTGIIE